ncbi:MAG TPA: heavy metal-responsive transcriptional regulator [Hellea balneolensis]|uniref:Heavy metal-responsive transcriptional regulator n=1 Tax=Hellea balneolensis TaxID=287478 RepID=A0A7C3G4X2_9PROT|nr:heavy metal-responsive transcriptional regulator [Hellea balneolensis]
MSAVSTLAIGQLAKTCGVNIDTVRYYERQDLLLPTERTPSGYRRYSHDSVRRLRFIRKAQSLGFTLSEIKNLLNLAEDDDADCGDVRACAREKIAQLEPRIADMLKIKKGLEELARFCPGNGKPLSECSILEYFYQEDDAS